MRLTRILGLAALSSAIAFATLASPAGAEEEHFDLKVAKGQITITAKPGWHINQDYSWSVKKGSDKVKAKEDFKLEKATASVSGVPSGSYTVKGAVCSENACAPFKRDDVSVP
jgi:hypothetical protein